MRPQDLTAIARAGALLLALNLSCAADDSSRFQPSGSFTQINVSGNSVSAPAANLPVPMTSGAPGDDGYSPFTNFGRATGAAAASGPPLGESHPFLNFGRATGGDPVKSMAQGLSPSRGFGIVLPPGGGSLAPSAERAPEIVAQPLVNEAVSSGEDSSGGDSAAPKGAAASGAGKFGPKDAAANFSTVVETYLARHGSLDRWAYVAGGRTRVLDYLEVDAKRLKKEGPLYAACVRFRDARGGGRVRLVFSVDFNDEVWRVASVKAPSRGGPCSD